MARKTTEIEFDPEVHKAPTIDLNVLEVRGRGDKWHVYYPQAENISSPLPVYDRDGKLKEVVDTWQATNKYSECYTVFSSVEEAKDYAEQIHPGCEVKIITLSKPSDNFKRKKVTDDN